MSLYEIVSNWIVVSFQNPLHRLTVDWPWRKSKEKVSLHNLFTLFFQFNCISSSLVTASRNVGWVSKKLLQLRIKIYLNYIETFVRSTAPSLLRGFCAPRNSTGVAQRRSMSAAAVDGQPLVLVVSS